MPLTYNGRGHCHHELKIVLNTCIHLLVHHYWNKDFNADVIKRIPYGGDEQFENVGYDW